MRFFERRNEFDEAGPGGPSLPEGPGNSETSRHRREAERFLNAGDEAIRRALSGDSQSFLMANLQTGGQ